MLLESEYDAVCDDGHQDGVLERRPLDYETGVFTYAVLLAKDKEGCGGLCAFAPTAPSILIPAWRHDQKTRFLIFQQKYMS